MKKLESDLITQKYTTIYYDENFKYNAPHNFEVLKSEVQNSQIAKIHFQEGPIKECGINGVNNEDLIAMVIKRLECFNESEYHCRENSVAITKLEESIMWLRKRTNNRQNKNIKGTSKI